MEPKELVGLYEAYQQVYEPQELTEEVEIVTEYFYEMGLNENGIDILIEELGEEEFIDWVYDIAEEYVLSETTRLQSKASQSGRILTGPKGSRPQSTTKAREKKQGGLTMRSTSSPSSTIRKKAVSTAKAQQEPTPSTPEQTKKGMGGLIGSILQRAKQDTELLKKSWKTARDVGKEHEKKVSHAAATVAGAVAGARKFGKKVEQSPQATRARRVATVAAGRAAQAAGRTAIKAAGAAGAAAGEGVKAHRQGKTGAQIAGRAAGTFVRKMTREEYEYILEHLLDEGYANSIENAEKIVVNMSEQWVLDVLDEAVLGARKGTIRSVIEKGGKSIKYVQSGGDIVAGDRAAQARASAADRVRSGRNRANDARAEQARRQSIERLNAKPGEDPGDYDSGYYGDDDTSDGKRHYSLSHTNRDARRRRASGRG